MMTTNDGQRAENWLSAFCERHGFLCEFSGNNADVWRRNIARRNGEEIRIGLIEYMLSGDYTRWIPVKNKWADVLKID